MSHATVARGVGGVLVLVGGAGLVSGLFTGKYFMALNVAEAKGSSTPWFTYPAMSTGQGDWADFWASTWALSGLSSSDYPAPDFSGSLDEWFQANVKEGWGVEKNYVDTECNAVGSTGSVVWGPLGQHAALVMVGTVGLGLGLMLAANRL